MDTHLDPGIRPEGRAARTGKSPVTDGPRRSYRLAASIEHPGRHCASPEHEDDPAPGRTNHRSDPCRAGRVARPATTRRCNAHDLHGPSPRIDNMDASCASVVDEISRTNGKSSLLFALNDAVLAGLASAADKGLPLCTKVFGATAVLALGAAAVLLLLVVRCRLNGADIAAEHQRRGRRCAPGPPSRPTCRPAVSRPARDH